MTVGHILRTDFFFGTTASTLNSMSESTTDFNRNYEVDSRHIVIPGYRKTENIGYTYRASYRPLRTFCIDDATRSIRECQGAPTIPLGHSFPTPPVLRTASLIVLSSFELRHLYHAVLSCVTRFRDHRHFRPIRVSSPCFRSSLI